MSSRRASASVLRRSPSAPSKFKARATLSAISSSAVHQLSAGTVMETARNL